MERSDLTESRIVYVSRRRDTVSDADIVDHLVFPAMAKNRRLDVTGCLWFDGFSFVQVLEGHEEMLDALFGEIASDARHDSVTTLERAPIDERCFRRWSLRVLHAEQSDEVRSLTREFLPPATRRGRGAARTSAAAAPSIDRLLELLVARSG